MDNLCYFDHAATTRCCPEAIEALCKFSDEEFGNPSSSHCLGRSAQKGMEESRALFAAEFAVSPQQVIFTGSGTEADNLAISGVALRVLSEGKRSGPPSRIIVSAVEHPAVLKTAEFWKAFGFDVQIAPVDSDGKVTVAALLPLVNPETCLISVMTVNNIVGSVQPVEALAQAAKAKNPNLIFHTDSIQAFGKIPLPKAGSGVDLISLSGHKIQGPKGVGALICLDSRLVASKRFVPILHGGGQEHGLRSGTQSPSLIAAFGVAARIALSKRVTSWEKVLVLNRTFRDALVQSGLLGQGQKSKLRWNSPDDAIPHIANLSAPHYPAGQITKMLESKGFLIATGSACSVGKTSEERSLVAMGCPPEVCQAALRISFSELETPAEVRGLATALSECLAEMDQLLGAG